MRGAPARRLVPVAGDGIIPADAGSTTYCSSLIQPGKDHPRGCGEHGLFFHPPLRSQGSSPRMRGAQIGLR